METGSEMARIPGTKLYTVTVGSTRVEGLSYDDAVKTLIKLLYGNKEKQEKEDNNG